MWWLWLIILTIAIVTAFGLGYDLGRELTELKQFKRSLWLTRVDSRLQRWENELEERERRDEEREAEKRAVTTLKVHEATHGRAVFVVPPENLIRVFEGRES